MIPLIDTHSHFDAVIIAAGDYPSHPIPLSAIGNARMVVCCDGAVATALEHGVMPDAVVGDGDSLDVKLKEMLADRLHISESTAGNWRREIIDRAELVAAMLDFS